MQLIHRLDEISEDMNARVGPKLASLIRMKNCFREVSKAPIIPQGFALTDQGFKLFLQHNELEEHVRSHLKRWKEGEATTEEVACKLKEMLQGGDIPPPIEEKVRQSWEQLEASGCSSVSVRSSVVCEEGPVSAFADQQESFLNLKSSASVLEKLPLIYASLFQERSLTYAEKHDIDLSRVRLAVGVQELRGASGCRSGILLTFDPEWGTTRTVEIHAVPGLGVNLNSGQVSPDRYELFKPFLEPQRPAPIIFKESGSRGEQVRPKLRGEGLIAERSDEAWDNSFLLTDPQAAEVARWGRFLEEEFGPELEVEWSLDEDDTLFFLQARSHSTTSQSTVFETFKVESDKEPILTGAASGNRIASGRVVVAQDPEEIGEAEHDIVLVTSRCDPDWVASLGKAVALVTDQGGSTSHASMVARELGIPAALGTETGTDRLQNGQIVTVSCAEGDEAFVYEGEVDYEVTRRRLEPERDLPVKIKINVADPRTAFRWESLPVDGIGLARSEWIISQGIGLHPLACLKPELLEPEIREQVEHRSRFYDSPREFFLESLVQSAARLAAGQWPNPVLLRTSDFKTNEYRDMVGGEQFEEPEANPMLGWRGAARYTDEDFKPAFELECEAIRRVRDELGFVNVAVLIPFCRTIPEADEVLRLMADCGLARGANGLEIHVMAELPSNIILAEEFASRFDGFSIGTNDLTQLILGVDRDSGKLSSLFDARDPAVMKAVEDLIRRAKAKGAEVGLCGNAPSLHPEFGRFLVEAGIDSISVEPDSLMELRKTLQGIRPKDQ